MVYCHICLDSSRGMPVIVVPKTLRDIQTSRPLVVAVVFAALMLDVMLMTSIGKYVPCPKGMEVVIGRGDVSLTLLFGLMFTFAKRNITYIGLKLLFRRMLPNVSLSSSARKSLLTIDNPCLGWKA